METIKAIATRKSTRAYKPDQLSKDTLNKILVAGCAAPVAAGLYDTMHLTAIQSEKMLNQLTNIMVASLPVEAKEMMEKMTGRVDPLYGAPTVVIISSKEPTAPGADYVNAGCIAENMMLAAADAGVDSVVLWATGGTAQSNTELKNALSIPNNYTALFGVGFGYATIEDSKQKDLAITIDVSYV
nr:nitroreductase family protein [Sedimentibacter sp.]